MTGMRSNTAARMKYRQNNGTAMPSKTHHLDQDRLKELRGVYQGSESPEAGLMAVRNDLYRSRRLFDTKSEKGDFSGDMMGSMECAWEEVYQALEDECTHEEVVEAWIRGANRDGAFIETVLAALQHAGGADKGWPVPTIRQFMEAEALGNLDGYDFAPECWASVAVLGRWPNEYRRFIGSLVPEDKDSGFPTDDTIIGTLNILSREDRALLLGDGLTTDGNKRWFGTVVRDLPDDWALDAHVHCLIHSNSTWAHGRRAKKAVAIWG